MITDKSSIENAVLGQSRKIPDYCHFRKSECERDEFYCAHVCAVTIQRLHLLRNIESVGKRS
jgi:hypothetical protein